MDWAVVVGDWIFALGRNKARDINLKLSRCADAEMLVSLVVDASILPNPGPSMKGTRV
jgi:hypothetical protein